MSKEWLALTQHPYNQLARTYPKEHRTPPQNETWMTPLKICMRLLERWKQGRRYVHVRVVPGPPWPEKKKIIYNILKFFIYLPLKKKIGTPQKKLGIPSDFLMLIKLNFGGFGLCFTISVKFLFFFFFSSSTCACVWLLRKYGKEMGIWILVGVLKNLLKYGNV